MHEPALPSEKVPFGHLVHVVAPATAPEYVPLGHASHVEFLPSTLEAVPISHLTQSVSVWLSHATHPGSKLYLPAAHLMHGPPLGPHRPGMQEQFVLSHESGSL